jgi:cell shape-determining protein MreC
MKKTYLARRNALISPKGLSWGAGALLFAILFSIFRFVAPNLFLTAVTPLFGISDSISRGSHAFFAHFSDAAALSSQNEKLAAENAELASENAALVAKVAAQDSLMGGAAVRAPGIYAEIVSRPPTSPYDRFILAAGSKDGVVAGMEAFGPGNVPLGIVSSVLADFSELALFSAPDMVTHGWVGRAGLPIAITGAGGGALNASAPRAANVAAGDTVYLPGPGQLPIGSVARVESDPLSPAVTLRIAPAVNLFSIPAVVLRATGITGVSFATSTLP